MKIQMILPRGENIIVHSARMKLELNCTDFCVFDTILQRKLKGKETSYFDIENYTGLEPIQIQCCINIMVKKNLVVIKDNQFYLNKKLVDDAYSEKENDLEKEFNIFWKTIKDDEEINCWPGPRQASLEKFKEARKKYSFDFILNQKKNYFKLLEHETWRKPMQATKFLNVKTGQIEEDFVSQWPDHFKQELNKKTDTLTMKDKDNLYK